MVDRFHDLSYVNSSTDRAQWKPQPGINYRVKLKIHGGNFFTRGHTRSSVGASVRAP